MQEPARLLFPNCLRLAFHRIQSRKHWTSMRLASPCRASVDSLVSFAVLRPDLDFVLRAALDLTLRFLHHAGSGLLMSVAYLVRSTAHPRIGPTAHNLVLASVYTQPCQQLSAPTHMQLAQIHNLLQVDCASHTCSCHLSCAQHVQGWSGSIPGFSDLMVQPPTLSERNQKTTFLRSAACQSLGQAAHPQACGYLLS